MTKVLWVDADVIVTADVRPLIANSFVGAHKDAQIAVVPRPFKKVSAKPMRGAAAVQDDAPPPGYYIHEVGGAAMGHEENTSVVDRWNRLWRGPNVLVVDGACWPSSGWQSPTLTMMAITRRACLQAVRPWNG